LADFQLDEDVSEMLEPLLEGLGHDVFTTRYLRSKRTKDSAQLSLAARFGRIFVTHNGDDYELLHRAWRQWSNEWDVMPRPLHAGILVIPQQPRLSLQQTAHEVDTLIRRQSVTT
jgi:hypothetical protein